MTKIEEFREFLADMDGLNSLLAILARESAEATAARAALLRRGKAVGLTIMAVDQMLASIRVDYRLPENVVAEAVNLDDPDEASAEGNCDLFESCAAPVVPPVADVPASSAP